MTLKRKNSGQLKLKYRIKKIKQKSNTRARIKSKSKNLNHQTQINIKFVQKESPTTLNRKSETNRNANQTLAANAGSIFGGTEPIHDGNLESGLNGAHRHIVSSNIWQHSSNTEC